MRNLQMGLYMPAELSKKTTRYLTRYHAAHSRLLVYLSRGSPSSI